MSCERVDEEKGLVWACLESFGDARPDSEDSSVSWRVIEQIFIISAHVCNSVPGEAFSYLIDVQFAIRKVLDPLHDLDPSELAQGLHQLLLVLYFLVYLVVHQRGVANEAGDVGKKRVMSKFVFLCLRLHLINA